MKKIFQLAIISFAVVMLVSCSKSEDDNKDNGTWVKVVSGASYSPCEFASAIAADKYLHGYTGDNNAIALVVDGVLNAYTAGHRYYLDTFYARKQHVPLLMYERNWQIESYSFYYKSISSYGQPILLSGRVTFPNTIAQEGHEVQSMSLVTHYFNGRDGMPSLSLTASSLRAIFNSAVIEPDYQGYGVSEGYPYCGFSFAIEGRQAADCLFAAMEVMRQHGVTLAANGYTTNWGYSIGAPAAVSFARYYDEQMTREQRAAIRLKSTFAGGGPMLLDRLIEAYDSDMDFDASLAYCVIPMLAALPQDVFAPYALEELAPEWMHTHMVEIDGKEYSFYEVLVNDMQGYSPYPEEYDNTKLYNHFSSEMSMEDGHLNYSNAKTQLLLKVLHQQSDWGNWIPRTKIYMSHCATDNRMPYSQAKEFYNMKKSSGNVYWKGIEAPLTSLVCGDDRHSAATMDATLRIATIEDPEAAWKSAK